MTVLQQLLLLPLLSPLLAVLLLAAVNPKPPVALRLLIWTSPALPLGAWMAAAAASGAALSAAATTLALRQQGRTGAAAPSAPRREHRRRPWQPPRSSNTAPAPGPAPQASPSRKPGEPAPTVEVPFKVIRKPAAAAPAQPPTAAQPAAAKAVGDGWDQPLSSDWD